MRSIVHVLSWALQLYVYILIAAAVMSWLIAFGVVNMRNDAVRTVWNFVYQVTEPVLRPIRNILPNLGGVDISPIILLLIILLIQGWLADLEQYLAINYFLMGARRIDGAAIAAGLRERVATDVAAMAAAGTVPGLAVVLVGDDSASRVYVASKERATIAAGMRSFEHRLPANTTEAELLALVTALNRDEAVDGILVQLPLPPQIDAGRVLLALDPDKDVDGFHPVNAGRLATGAPALVPCTPLGCVLLAKTVVSDLAGLEAVVVGRSNIVGKPLAQLLLAESATVTVAHSRTRDLPAVCRRADLLLAAVGRPNMIRGGWIKPGATVIDVGINRVPDPATGKTRLVGDVAFDEAVEVAGAITPVPGGVGPMTIACLLANTVTAARLRRGLPAAS